MDDILYSGFLEKQGKIPTLWSNKWCILKKDGFYWYSVKNESMPPEGMIELLNHCYVKADEENFHILTSNNLGKGGFTFITPNKKYHFKTTNEMERVQWFSVIIFLKNILILLGITGSWMYSTRYSSTYF
jgi:hypothetical protein